ncbi:MULTISPECIES: FAD-binding oxidoreductase [Psychrobacter]|uniref:D-lactate dehydrogenase (cytochrome) n=1 Tax=Psychrobacter alimentarius TaxID=261164 RepID=A0ABM5ZZF6_9GAMM|nr:MULTISPECIES: FAD-linked oxidase C-terminal domain-containing protein [Psychrobacter]AMT97496.1 D-lactate dehydrogenase [Psychrobacter alimentarius]
MSSLPNSIMNDSMKPDYSTAIADLKIRFGQQLSTNTAVCEQHGHTMTWLANQPPDAVLTVQDKHDVAAAVEICNQHHMPVIAFGIGSSLEGQLNAPFGGLCIDMHAMDAILQVNNEDLTVTVQPGVTREQLNHYLRDTGLFFPIDPGANASIGGMVATRASGTNAVRYGTMKDVVLALEVVTANGDIVRTGTRAKKSAAGYDLTRLMIGSEGTLGIVTEITLKLFGISECIGSGICHFPTIEDACQAVMLTIQMCLPIARIELLDALQIKACNQYDNLSLTETPTLFVEFHGTEASVQEQAQIFTEIIEEFGGKDFSWDTNEAERKRLWQARHNAYHASSALRPKASALSTDACVPISRLAECVSETAKDIEASGMIGPIVGHVGDGNFHVLLLVDTDNPTEIATAEDIIGRLAKRAIEMDGTCTGEHGIGQGKQKYMQQEHGNALVLMQAIKAALDPNNILNPGKIWPHPISASA